MRGNFHERKNALFAALKDTFGDMRRGRNGSVYRKLCRSQTALISAWWLTYRVGDEFSADLPAGFTRTQGNQLSRRFGTRPAVVNNSTQLCQWASIPTQQVDPASLTTIKIAAAWSETNRSPSDFHREWT